MKSSGGKPMAGTQFRVWMCSVIECPCIRVASYWLRGAASGRTQVYPSCRQRNMHTGRKLRPHSTLRACISYKFQKDRQTDGIFACRLRQENLRRSMQRRRFQMKVRGQNALTANQLDRRWVGWACQDSAVNRCSISPSLLNE